MRFNQKPYKKGMKLTDKPNDRWARDAAQAAKNIPILTRPPKGAPTYNVSVRLSAKLQQKAEEIRDSSPRFKSMSDVYRATFYVGLQLIYETIRDELPDDHMLHVLFRLQRMNEVMHQWMLGVDHIIDMTQEAKKYQQAGLLTQEKRNEFFNEIMESIPEQLRPMAKKKINSVLAGENASGLYECLFDNKLVK